MEKLTSKVFEYIKAKEMISNGDKVVVGVSGGADSVALLLLLIELKSLIEFELIAVHVEHGIRGEESLNDEAFVVKLCKEYDIELNTYHIEVINYAKENKLTVEEAARILRYECFYKLKSEKKANKIAVAHHMDDQAETVLFNMVRGSGIRGLSGIRPINGDIIRPLLGVQKSELIEYLNSRNVEYCIDATNMDVDYSRNRIRNNVIPELNQVTSAAVEHIAREAAELSEIDECISIIGDRIYKKCVILRRRNNRTEYSVDIEMINKCHIVLQRYVIKKIIWKLEERWKDIGYNNIEDVLSLLHKQSGKHIDLPRELKCIRITDELILYKENHEEEGTEYSNPGKRNEEEKNITDGSIIEINSGRVEVKVFARPDGMSIPTDTYTKWFDYDKIEGGVCIRNRRPGDFIIIDDNGNSQSYKKFCISSKIPLDMRYSIPLIAKDKELLWVIGYRMGFSYRVTDETKNIMEIKFIGGSNNE